MHTCICKTITHGIDGSHIIYDNERIIKQHKPGLSGLVTSLLTGRVVVGPLPDEL